MSCGVTVVMAAMQEMTVNAVSDLVKHTPILANDHQLCTRPRARDWDEEEGGIIKTLTTW